jgi:peptidoglycan DL-endopeptidase CwlO
VLLPSAPAAQAAMYTTHRAAPAAHRETVGARAVAIALHLRGTPYVWSGSTPAGFDCSGFTRWVYGRLGIHLPHSSYAQWSLGRHVTRAHLLPGDLVFFAGLGHVGIYVGHGHFIHAPESGRVVSVDPLNSGWYGSTYAGAVRLPGTQHGLSPKHAVRRLNGGLRIARGDQSMR